MKDFKRKDIFDYNGLWVALKNLNIIIQGMEFIMDLKRRQPIGVELVKRGVVSEDDIQ